MGDKPNDLPESPKDAGGDVGSDAPSAAAPIPAPDANLEPELSPRLDLLEYAAAWNIAWMFVVAGIVAVLAMYLFPSTRNFTGPHGNEYATASFLLALPGLSGIWAVAGTIAARHRLHRISSLLALVFTGAIAVLLWRVV